VQVAQINARFGRASDALVSRLHLSLLDLFLRLGCARDGVEFGVEAAVGDSVVFHLDEVL